MSCRPRAANENRDQVDRPVSQNRINLRTVYAVFDSFRKLPTSRADLGEFNWNIVTQGATLGNAIGVEYPLTNVIEVAMGPFVFPLVPDVPYVVQSNIVGSTADFFLFSNNDTTTNGSELPCTGDPPSLVPYQLSGGLPYGQYPVPTLVPTTTAPTPSRAFPWLFNPYGQLPCGGTLTTQLRELGSRGFNEGASVHQFEHLVTYPTDAETGPLVAQAVPMDGAGWEQFYLSIPVRTLEAVSLVFRGPDRPIAFEPDVLFNVECGMVLVASTFTNTWLALRFTYAGHGLRAGDRVFFTGRGFPLQYPQFATVNDYLLRPEGHAVNVEPGYVTHAPVVHPSPGELLPSPSVFCLDPTPVVHVFDAGGPPTVAAIQLTMFIARRRIRVPMRFRCLIE